MKKLPNESVKQLHSNLKLKKIQGRDVNRLRAAIAHCFFTLHPECPLTELEKYLSKRGITVVTEQQGKPKQGTKRKQKATVLSFGLTSDQSVNTRNSKKSKTNAGKSEAIQN